MRTFDRNSIAVPSSAGLLSPVLAASPIAVHLDDGPSLRPASALAKGGKGNDKDAAPQGVRGSDAGPLGGDKTVRGNRGQGRGPGTMRGMDGSGVGGNGFGRLNADNLGNNQHAVDA